MAEGEARVIQYASHPRRALAILVDLLIWAALLLPLISTIASGDEARIAAVVMNTFSAWILIFGIYGYLILQRGQTVGKWLFRTKVRRLDGSWAGMGQLMLRYLIPLILVLIPYVGPLLLLADLIPAFGKQRQALHDRIVGTVVVDR